MNQLGEQIREALPYDGKNKVLVQDHNTADIINYFDKLHPELQRHYNKISELHWQGDAEKTARHLFDFCKKNIKYNVEGPDDQTIKKPGRTLVDGFGDCKHYAGYIVGVCDSLYHKGYPIKAWYRFSADKPGATVHHVFAVVQGEGPREYWTDPVLSSFNKRPNYAKIKDSDMALSLLSGTSIGCHDDNTIGKAKHNNVFKKIAHGIKVSEQNAAKGIKTAAAEVKQVALKVAASPARNSFLALVDFNMFNLAKHLHTTMYGPKRGALLNEWKKLGGSEQKLKNAINNGIRNYNKHHGGKLSMVAGGNIEAGIQHFLTHTYPWHHRQLPHRNNRYRGTITRISNGHRPAGPVTYQLRGTEIGCYQGEHAAQIGCLPACAPAMIAMASAILAALGKFMDQSAAEKKQMADAAKGGAKDLVKHAAKGIDMANGEGGADALDMLTKKSGGGAGMPSMNVSTETGDDGTPTLAIHAAEHPLLKQAGTPNLDTTPGGADDGSADNTEGKEITPMPGGGGGIFADMSGKLHQFWTDYKTPIEFGIAGIVIFKLLGNKSVRKALHIK